MTSVLYITLPPCDQVFTYELICRGDKEGISVEFPIFGYDVNWSHHALEPTVIAHPMPLRAPALGLRVILDVPSVFVTDEKRGPARSVRLGLVCVRIVVLPKLHNVAHSFGIFPAARRGSHAI